MLWLGILENIKLSVFWGVKNLKFIFTFIKVHFIVIEDMSYV